MRKGEAQILEELEAETKVQFSCNTTDYSADSHSFRVDTHNSIVALYVYTIGLIYSCKLTRIPDSIGNLPNLREFCIAYHGEPWGSPRLPETMLNLKHLETLVLIDCDLTFLPDWIGELTSLRRLNVSKNKITQLPASLRHLTNLKTLILEKNDLEILPDWIGDLINLETLNLHQCHLTSLPDSLQRLTKLQVLDLNHQLRGPAIENKDFDDRQNRIRILPEGMKHLTDLRVLRLYMNGIRSLPDWIGELVNLEEVDLSYNILRYLPESLGNLQHLKKLELFQNYLPRKYKRLLRKLKKRGCEVDDYDAFAPSLDPS